jgi:hypothetical protein
MLRRVLAAKDKGAKEVALLCPVSLLFANGYLLKFACTEVSLVRITPQVGVVPEHAPPQLAKVLPAGAVEDKLK